MMLPSDVAACLAVRHACSHADLAFPKKVTLSATIEMLPHFLAFAGL